jgi:hypothetical protein
MECEFSTSLCAAFSLPLLLSELLYMDAEVDMENKEFVIYIGWFEVVIF